MKNKTLIKLAAGSMALAACAPAEQIVQMYGDKPMDEVIAQMTLEQKANMVLGTARGPEFPPDAAPGMPNRQVDFAAMMKERQEKEKNGEEQEDVATLIFGQGRVPGDAAEGFAIDSLNIPSIAYADGPAGLRINPTRPGDENTYYCTAFPTGTILAASWDPAVVEKITKAMGNEVLEYGVDVLLAPAMNIHRNPLCGRNFEYYSEDPILAGKIATAYVNGVQSNGVGVSVKHFAINNQETMRNGIDEIVSERAAREIYLKGFEMVVKDSQPWTIMSSYNKINGVLASENKWLLTDVLRGEWGFDGIVMTDWWAEENGARQQAAGNDLLMPGTKHQYEEIIAGVNDGTLAMEDLDRNIANILNLIQKTPTFKGYKYSNKPDLKAHAQLVREEGSCGTVLLKNQDNVLPLTGGQKVAVFGNSSYDTYVGGTGSGNVNRAYKVSIFEGLKNAGFTLVEDVEKAYTSYIDGEKSKQAAENFWATPVIPELKLSEAQVNAAVAAADVVVYTIGRQAGEGADRKEEKGDYYLTDVEVANLNAVVAATHAAGKKLVVLLNMGSIIELTDQLPEIDALVHVFMPGQEAGNSIADVLSGKVTPSGKLPMTWAKRYADYSSAKNFPLSAGETGTVKYEEDIFVGYRGFDKDGIEPLFPFGFGLSYTTFEYANLNVTTSGDEITVSVDVKNTGAKAGREIVQVYVSAPKGELVKPVKELKTFAKTAVLEPGKTETLTMTIKKSDLASFDEAKHQWVVDPGTYTFHAASSAANLNLSTEVKL